MDIEAITEQPAFQVMQQIPDTPPPPQLVNAPLTSSHIAVPDALAPIESGKGLLLDLYI